MARPSQREESGPVKVPYLPGAQIINMVLSEREWGTLPELKGIITAPVLRPDGTILQEHGYDLQTGYWLSPQVEISVPEMPSDEDVREARTLILDQVLADFPWRDPPSKANAVAMMFCPHMRPYLGGLSPLFAVSATQPGTGKGLLCSITGTPYGMSTQTIPDNQELRKTITSILGDTAEPVVALDNIDRPLRSPELAAVLTMDRWSSRILARNKVGTFLNDRTWIANGNQLQLAGDMPRRAIWIGLDYPYEDPAGRSCTSFKIADMYTWLERSRAALLRAQLIMLRAWILAGAPRDETQVMGGFTSWVRAMGGFLEFHGIGGFRGNQDELLAHDQGGGELGALFRAWRGVFGTRYVAIHDLHELGTTGWITASALGQAVRETVTQSASEAKEDGPDAISRFRAAYPVAERTDKPYGKTGLGRYLSARTGRWAGGYTLRRGTDDHGNSTYAVLDRKEAADAEKAKAGEGSAG
jgi:hypothetical protein